MRASRRALKSRRHCSSSALMTAAGSSAARATVLQATMASSAASAMWRKPAMGEGSVMGIDATFPYGANQQKAADVPAGDACGPAVAEQGHEYFKVADVPGWQDYDFPELKRSGS